MVNAVSYIVFCLPLVFRSSFVVDEIEITVHYVTKYCPYILNRNKETLEYVDAFKDSADIFGDIFYNNI